MQKTKKLKFWLSLLIVAMVSLLVFACGGGGGGSSSGGPGGETGFVAPEHPGTGTVDDPFLVYSVETLQYVGKPTTDGDYDDWTLNAHYKQLTNIDLSSVENWDPIGSASDNSFTGIYDGNNKKITNLKINVTGESQGLFGYMNGNGTTTGIVKNIGLENVNIVAGNSVGGVAGRTQGGRVENCYVTGDVKGSNYVGGVVGYLNNGTVANCYATSDISGSMYVGGVVGRGDGNIAYCYAIGDVTGTSFYVGGITGGSNGMIRNNVALNPTIKGGGSSGRITGQAGFYMSTYTYARNDMTVNGSLVSMPTDLNGTNIDETQYYSADWWTTLGTTWTTNAWSTSVWNITDNCLPTLINNPPETPILVLPVP